MSAELGGTSGVLKARRLKQNRRQDGAKELISYRLDASEGEARVTMKADRVPEQAATVIAAPAWPWAEDPHHLDPAGVWCRSEVDHTMKVAPRADDKSQSMLHQFAWKAQPSERR
jgi:hypothetical protein